VEKFLPKFSLFLFIVFITSVFSFAQNGKSDEKAEAILKRAVQNLGGEKYLQVKSIVGRGKFSLMKDNQIISFQNFVDVIVYPDKERTEFKSSGSRVVQTNVGDGGWIFDGDAQTINEQTKEQIEGFKRGIRTSLDNLLRGSWRGKANLIYAGRRQASLGKRNDVLKLTFEDGFAVEFEFADDGLPMKALFTRLNPDKEEIKEEDRYAQFVDVQGIKTPFIIDRFSNKQQSSRINYETVEFNKQIPDSIFTKPKSAKELKKDLKF
jgi:outer membrane lipoprotein-sorting protein